MKKGILCFLLFWFLLFQGCFLLKLPFQLLNSIFGVAKSLVPYSLFAFSTEGERGSGVSKDALASVLRHALDGQRNWETLSSVEDTLAVLEKGGGDKIYVAVPMNFEEDGTCGIDVVTTAVETVLRSKGFPLPALSPKVFFANGCRLNLEPSKVRELKEECRERGNLFVFMPFDTKRALLSLNPKGA